MTPDPLDELEALEAKRRHPAGRQLDPQTGRVLPHRIPAVPEPSRSGQVLLAILWGCMAGVILWLVLIVLIGSLR